MNTNKKYLNDLKENLTKYTKDLASTENYFKSKGDKGSDKIIKSLQDSLKEASNAYERLESASAEEWESLKKVASTSFDQLKGAFDEFKDTASEQITEYAKYMEEQAHDVLKCGVEYIKNNPYKSILLAAVLGIILGKVLK